MRRRDEHASRRRDRLAGRRARVGRQLLDAAIDVVDLRARLREVSAMAKVEFADIRRASADAGPLARRAHAAPPMLRRDEHASRESDRLAGRRARVGRQLLDAALDVVDLRARLRKVGARWRR